MGHDPMQRGFSYGGGYKYRNRALPTRGGAFPSIRIDLTGDRELILALNGLSDKLMRKVVRFATPKAMKPVIKDAQRRAKSEDIVETGLLAKSIGHKTKTYLASGAVVTVVGPRTGFGKEVTVTLPDGRKYQQYRDPAQYAHLVEFGTAPHSLGKGSSRRKDKDTGGQQHPGSAPQPFMRPAFDSNQNNVIRIMKEELRRGIEKYGKANQKP